MMSGNINERTPLMNNQNHQPENENLCRKRGKKVVFNDLVVPLTVGGPYKSSTPNAEGFWWLHSDACMSSALFCLAYVAMRFVILMGTVINRHFPGGAENRIKTGWIIMQEITIVWTSIAIIIQISLLAVVLCKHKFFQEQHKSSRHETEENQIWVRTGIVLFSIGSVVLYSSRIFDNCHCLHLGYYRRIYHGCEITSYFISIIFIIIQSIYLLVTSKKHIKIQNHPVPRYAYMYLVGTNVIISMYYFATEAFEAVFKSMEHPYYLENNIIEPDFASCKVLHHTQVNAILWYFFVYLHPFVVEFNLLSVEILCHQWAEMGPLELEQNEHPEEVGGARPEQNGLVQDRTVTVHDLNHNSGQIQTHEHPEDGGRARSEQNYHGPETVHVLTQNASQIQIKKNENAQINVGLVVIFLLSALLTCMSGLLNAIHGYHPNVPYLLTIYLIYDSILKVFCIGAILWGFNFYTFNPKEKSKNSGFSGTDILLTVSGICYLFLNLMVLIADLTTEEEKWGKKIGNFFIDSTYCIFIWFQTLFIIFIQHRPLPKKSTNVYNLTLIMAALGIHSLFIWAKMSFIDLNVGRWYPTSSDTYGITTFMGCLYVFYPIGFYYYFTSARLFYNYYHQICKLVVPSNPPKRWQENTVDVNT